ncbi:MAG: four-carbon acid sugar kinase family protein, partial [Gemmatimonadaceae bacterium]|nr:four-carbon acid sugar kinase family protein [Acetobacteraceae bacterium]
CVMAPAFPATGRTTEAGCVRLNGQALEATTLWRRDHTYSSGDLVAMLAAVGLQVQAVALADVRAGSEAVMRRVYDAAEGGMDAVVCDAVVQGDLDIVARATLPLASQLFWTGSGGLALALAQVLAEAGVMSGVVSADPCPVAGGILLVVGSLAEASRGAAAQLADQGVLLTVAIPPATLLAGPDGAAWQDAQRRIADALARGEDVLVELTADAHADLSESAALARQLAALLQPVGPSLGALFATGGETALAILDALGVTGIRLVDEIEPGVPLGFMRGALTAPVVTKAGAFGDAGTLIRCLAHLRSLRRTETAI